jgi:methylmalonyl-CoA epimerase
VLDHIGIAVKDLPAALAFYRDALGLEVEAPEDVASQHVRAHFVPVGESKLELLEATAPESAIAKYVDTRGPGLHHITLRVDDIHAALAQLKSRGARLIDEQPRPGADDALVAFVHPSSAHGVLVELKQSSVISHQSSVGSHQTAIRRFTIGGLELISLCDGFFRIDGGALFGAVPRVLWEKKAVPDERNRVLQATRPLLVRGARTLLIDAGFGEKENDTLHDLYVVDRRHTLEDSLADAGLSVDDIDIVLATHLHFDHAGGFTVRDAGGRLRPKFPRAQYVVRRGEWDDAMHPHARNRASYLAENYAPLADARVLQLVDADQTIMPGVKVRRTGGHTMHHQMVLIESGGRAAAFVADMMPTTAHASDAWSMGCDLYPMDMLAAKQEFAKHAVAKETLVFFEHDPAVAAGYLHEENGKRVVQPA